MADTYPGFGAKTGFGAAQIQSQVPATLPGVKEFVLIASVFAACDATVVSCCR
jgi:hypothetical protein